MSFAQHGDPKKDHDLLFNLMWLLSSNHNEYSYNELNLSYLNSFVSDDNMLMNLSIEACGCLHECLHLFKPNDHGIRGKVRIALAAVLNKSKHWRNYAINNSKSDSKLVDAYLSAKTNPHGQYDRYNCWSVMINEYMHDCIVHMYDCKDRNN